MRVRRKEDGKVFDVLGTSLEKEILPVRYETTYTTRFLIWENGQWWWVRALEYELYDENTRSDYER